MNISMLVKGLALGSLAVASTAFAAPKMGGDMYGIAGVGFNGYASAVSPVTVEAGAGKKISKDVSAEVVAAVTPGGTLKNGYLGWDTCKIQVSPQVGVSARGVYHVPVDFAGVKPYVGAGLAYYMSPSYKSVDCGVGYTWGSGFSGIFFDYTAGVEYPLSNKTKLYFDVGGVGANWGGTAGVKMGF